MSRSWSFTSESVSEGHRRRGGARHWLRPDAKTQVTVVYEEGRPAAVSDVLVSTQHAAGTERETIHEYVWGSWLRASSAGGSGLASASR